MGVPTAVAPLVAYRGDSWASPWWAVFINGAVVTPADWVIRAQARKNPATDDALFSWALDTYPQLQVGASEVEKRDGTVVTTGAVQLLLRPSDWVGKPASWSGFIDVEFSSDATDNPDFRYTVVRKRPFRIEGDVARV